MKTCTKCKKKKSLGDFNIDSYAKDGYHSQCKICRLVKSRLYNNLDSTKLRHKERHLNKAYGLTLEQYEALLKSQNYLCPVCKKERPTDVDHDHKTGKLRALLCKECNHGLGSFKDNPVYLQNAIEYLSFFSKNFS